jgi:hypothetical protein
MNQHSRWLNDSKSDPKQTWINTCRSKGDSRYVLHTSTIIKHNESNVTKLDHGETRTLQLQARNPLRNNGQNGSKEEF